MAPFFSWDPTDSLPSPSSLDSSTSTDTSPPPKKGVSWGPGLTPPAAIMESPPFLRIFRISSSSPKSSSSLFFVNKEGAPVFVKSDAEKAKQRVNSGVAAAGHQQVDATKNIVKATSLVLLTFALVVLHFSSLLPDPSQQTVALDQEFLDQRLRVIDFENCL